MIEQVSLEKEIEHLKCLLIHYNDFSCYEVFKLFDITGNGHLNLSDFRAAIEKLLSYEGSSQD